MPIVPELVTVGEASVSVAIHRDRLFANSFSVALVFSAAPGTFEIDVQTADYDQAGNYVKEIAITNANLSIGGLTARVELPQNVVSRFVRLYVVTFPNFATVTVQGTLV
jgi:NADH/NAD ratio-sensing transcriptional regulator Rex